MSGQPAGTCQVSLLGFSKKWKAAVKEGMLELALPATAIQTLAGKEAWVFKIQNAATK
jgi:hypothetical protein